MTYREWKFAVSGFVVGWFACSVATLCVAIQFGMNPAYRRNRDVYETTYTNVS